MGKVLNMTYASSLTDLCEVNSSFDAGVLRIAYTGKNRNRTAISKQAFERSLKTIYNCPIVCNYDRDTDALGGHDMEVVCDADGDMRLVNLTTPVGVIPESAKTWFANVEEEDGTVNEYLFAEALIWKRQEAYKKIKEDGITAQSMEITVKSGAMDGNVYRIDDFEFTAFCLISVEPCFESAALEMFSKRDFKLQLSEMMQDLRTSFNQVDTSKEDDNIHPQKYSMEGGKEVLEKKMELVAQYGIDVESLDFSIEELSIEELTERFEAIKAEADEQPEAPAEPTEEPEEPAESVEEPAEDGGDPEQNKFALTSTIIEELYRKLGEVTVEREWGECERYWYADCDLEANQVYCWDTVDWLLYGFSYTVDGDNVVIDFESKKRKKYTIVDFDEGEQASPFAEMFTRLEGKLHDSAEWEAKYNTASDKMTGMETELTELRQYKSDKEDAELNAARDAVIAQFSDLEGVEAFEQLCTEKSNYDIETLEEKCYALRGRKTTQVNFSLDNKSPKLPVQKTDVSDEPYGGIFTEYGISE